MSVDRVGLFPALANAARPRRRSRSMSDASTAPLLGEDAPAKPSLLGTEALRVPGTRHAGRHRARVRHGPAGACAARLLDDPRIRTLSLVIISRASRVSRPTRF